MPRKRKMSGKQKKAREVRQLRSGRAESEGESSDSSENAEMTEEVEFRDEIVPAQKLAPIFEKMQSSKKSLMNVSTESRKSSHSEHSDRSPKDIVQIAPASVELTDRRESVIMDSDSRITSTPSPNTTRESVRKMLFSTNDKEETRNTNGAVRDRDREENDTIRRDLREMEERLMKNQRESEARIMRANLESYNLCRNDMLNLLEIEGNNLKKDVNENVIKIMNDKSDRKENEELKLRISNLENMIEKINDNIRVGVEHQVSNQFLIEKNREKIKSLEELIIRKDKEIAALTDQAEGSDQYTRKLNLWIYGLEGNDKKPEDTLQRVKNFVINDLGANKETVQNWEIKHIHRVPTNNVEPSPIIVAFNKWKDKDYLLRQGKQLKGYNTGRKIWISFKHDLATGARAARKAMGVEAGIIRQNEGLLARVCDNAKGQVWLQTKKNKADNWETRKSYR